MTDRTEIWWSEFDKIGLEQVRKNTAMHIYGEARLELALQRIEYRESSDSSEERRRTLELARDANDLARLANDSASESNSIARAAADSARRSAAAARTNNIIATLALIAAIIPIALSIIGLFFRR
jgi:hypothetical protein